MRIHILIADADRELAEAAAWYLEAEGVRVTLVATAAEARAQRAVHAAVLDMDAPGAAELREVLGQRPDLPLLLLSAHSAAGTVHRPQGAMELVAHVRTLLQQTGLDRQAPLSSPDLRVFPEAREALVQGEPVPLTTLEFDLLVCLMRHPRTVLSRTQLGDAIWGDDFYGDLRLVDSHVSNLRAKLRAAGLDPMSIVTVRGAGYVFRPEG